MSKKFSLPGSSKTPRGATTNRGDFELILVHGSLQKKSPKTLLAGKMGVWQTRWFELTQTDIVYYSSQNDGQVRGVLPLQNITEVTRCEDVRRFDVHLQDLKPSEPSRTVELMATNGLQRERWVRALTTLTRGNEARKAERTARQMAAAQKPGQTESTRFGSRLCNAKLADAGGGLMVPQVLVELWRTLCAMPDGLQQEGAGAHRRTGSPRLLPVAASPPPSPRRRLLPPPTAPSLALPGIFRLSADSSELAAVKRAVHSNDGLEKAFATASASCLAALIKVGGHAAHGPRGERGGKRWVRARHTTRVHPPAPQAYLRELPDDIWASIREKLDSDVNSEEGDPATLVAQLPVREENLVVWLCQLMASVVEHEEVNRMGTRAVCTVIAPNLVVMPDTSDPMVMLTCAVPPPPPETRPARPALERGAPILAHPLAPSAGTLRGRSSSRSGCSIATCPLRSSRFTPPHRRPPRSPPLPRRRRRLRRRRR